MAFQIITLPPPILGLNTEDEPHVMQGRPYTPNMKNMSVVRTKVKKRQGYTTFGSNLPLPGIGMELISYSDGGGEAHLIALTTLSAHQYDASDNEWDFISPSTTVEDCDDAWTSGAGTVTSSADTSIRRVGSASVQLVMQADVADGDLLAHETITSVDFATPDYTRVSFWLFSDVELAVGSFELVFTSLTDGTKGGTFEEITNPSVIPASTWTRVDTTFDNTGLTGVQSVAAYSNHATELDGATINIDMITAYQPFSGTDKDRWSHTIATNFDEFINNSGTALIISNGAEGPYKFEGQAGDKFQDFSVSSNFTAFNWANEVEEFWNHLYLFNYRDNSVDFVRNLAFHDVSANTYANRSVTEVAMADSRGQIRRAKKLGYDMIIYSDNSISVARRVGGSTLFNFPTVIYESGLFAEKAVWDSVNIHYLLGTDRKIYAYAGGTQLQPIGRLIEEAMFDDIDISNKEYITTGLDPVTKKVYFFYPDVSQNYARRYRAINYKENPQTWESGEFTDSVRDFSIFDNKIQRACSDIYFSDITNPSRSNCDDAELVGVRCNDQTFQTGFPQTVIISDESNVFQLNQPTGTDNGTDIESWVDTPDLVPSLGRTDEYASWGEFAFSAKSSISGSTCRVYYTTLGDDAGDDVSGANWTQLSDNNGVSNIVLSDTWQQIYVPSDVTSQKIRYRIYQNSSGDLQIRGTSYQVQIDSNR